MRYSNFGISSITHPWGPVICLVILRGVATNGYNLTEDRFVSMRLLNILLEALLSLA